MRHENTQSRLSHDSGADGFLSALRQGPLLADGATGSLLFELTGRLSEPNHVYEALNLDNPDLIRQVHLSHLHAGARTLKTNTFEANETSLGRLGIHGRAEEISRAGVRLAKEAIASYREETGVDSPSFVLGSVGPAAGAGEPGEVEATYGPQVRTLVSEGVDALLLETFDSLPAAIALAHFARSVPGCPPVILHMSLRQNSADGSWNIEPAEFVSAAAAAGVAVVGVNCCAPWEALAFVEAVRSMPVVRTRAVLLSAMPNAGGFERIGRRYMSRVNPEFMGRLARTLVDDGARLIGGCCEVHPGHIREMSGFLRSKTASVATLTAPLPERPPAGPERKSGNGVFSEKLFRGEFVVSVEMLPPRGTGPKQLEDKATIVADLAKSGLAHAVDVTDGSRGIPLMPPGDFIQAIRERLGWDEATGDGVELIPHFTARDLNLMGIQSRLIGYFARRIHNVLFVTGDPPKMSPTYPRSTAVFDADSARMTELTHTRLNAGVDFGGQPLGRFANPETHFTIGTGFEPEALNIDGELAKLERKLEAGADYVMTQPVFRWDALDALASFRKRARILVGVMVLTGLAHAERFAQVPGVHVSPHVFEHFAQYESADDQRKAGIELAVEQVAQVRREGWAGLYLMSPATPALVPELLSAAAF